MRTNAGKFGPCERFFSYPKKREKKKHFTVYNKILIAVPFLGENFVICSSYVLHFYFIYIRI